jgi:Tfp pilus assembly protein FimT
MTGCTSQNLVSNDGEAGRSLVETAAICLIVSIILAFSLPAVASSIRAYNLRSTANHIVERLTAVRALAMEKNKNVTFSFNRATGNYGFDFTGTSGDGVPDTTDPADPGTGYYTETLPSGISTVFPDNTDIKVTFNSRGELPIGSASQSVVVRNSTSTLTIMINLRGRVWVQ